MALFLYLGLTISLGSTGLMASYNTRHSFLSHLPNPTPTQRMLGDGFPLAIEFLYK